MPDWGRERCRRVWDPGCRLLGLDPSVSKVEGVGFSAGLADRLLGLPAPLLERRHRGRHPSEHPDWRRSDDPHPNGIVVHPEAVMGSKCRIIQQATIGVGGPRAGFPTFGGHVDVGAGAKLLVGCCHDGLAFAINYL